MFRVAVLLSCIAVCCSHAVLPHLPLLVPAAHSVHVPLVAPHYGYGHGLWGHSHGYFGKSLGHHILKRSPHFVDPHAHGHIGHLGHVAKVAPIAHVAPVAYIAPVAVSHQSRFDVRTSPTVASIAVVNPVIAPVVAAPLAAPFHGLGHYAAGHGYYRAGLGHVGAGFAHLDAGQGHLGVGHGYGIGHY